MKRISVLTLIFGSVPALYGLTVESEAGLLSSKIDNPAAVSELVLTGIADASDFYFMERSMPSLRSLDMSGLTIVAYNGSPLGAVSYYKAGEIPAAVFAASELTDVKLPAGCTVGDFAFAGSRIAELSLPAGTVIGDGAFSLCPQLTSVSFGAGITLGHSSFRDCGMLGAVSGSENINVIPAQAFEGCRKLEKFDFGSGLKSIGEGAFAGSSVREADMSVCTALDNIGPWAFAGDVALEKTALPSHLVRIGRGVFFECTSLAGVSLPEGMTELPAYAFKDATGLDAALALPENLVTVGEYALMGATSVETISLPSSLETIGEGAMEGMSGLSSIDALELTSVPALGDGVWAGVKQADVVLNVDSSVRSAFESTAQWQEFNIQSISTSSKGPEIEGVKIRAAFDGHMLVVESTGAAIASVGVYDVAGMALFNQSGIESDCVRIDTSHYDRTVYIIDCILSDGTRGSVKILR